MKYPRLRVCLTLLSANELLVCSPLLAAEAIPSYQFLTHGFAGYVKGGAGFAFSPIKEITVTALGYDDDTDWSNGSATVSLVDSNGLQFVSGVITSNSPPFNRARYETISPTTLGAGQLFYLRSCWNDEVWSGFALLADGPSRNGTFSISPEITYLGAVGSTNADGTFPAEQHPPWELLIGPNFTYVVGTSVLVSGLQVTPKTAQIGFVISGKPASSFTLLESEHSGGPWTTNVNAALTTNVPGTSYTFTVLPDAPVKFYRVQIP